MVKCPNCGATAQITLRNRYHYSKGKIAEEYKCECGAKIIQHYKIVTSIIYTEDKVQYIKEDE